MLTIYPFLRGATVIDIGEDIDVDDYELIQIQTPQSIGEDIDIEDIFGIETSNPPESIGEDVDPD